MQTFRVVDLRAVVQASKSKARDHWDVGDVVAEMEPYLLTEAASPRPEDVAALRAELEKLKADKLALETAMAQERESLSELGNDLDAPPETRLQAWVAAYALDWAMDPQAKAPSKRLPLTAAGLCLLPEATIMPSPIDVEALRLHLANAQAELGRLGHELGKLRGDLQVALRLSGTATDEELVAAADRPTRAEYAALQASRDEARAAETKIREAWEHHRDLAETLIAERDEAREAEQRERERAEIAERAQNEVEHRACRVERELSTRPTEGALLAVEASLKEARAAEAKEREARSGIDIACRRMLESLPEDIRSRTGSTLLEQLESSIREVRPTLKAMRERAEKAESLVGRAQDDAGRWARKAGETERLLEASRRDTDALRQELATVNARMELKAEMDASFAERYENARRELEVVRLRAEKAESALAMAKEAARLDPDISDEGLLKHIRAWCERVRACERQGGDAGELAEIKSSRDSAERDADALQAVILALGRDAETAQGRIYELEAECARVDALELEFHGRLRHALRGAGLPHLGDRNAIAAAVEELCSKMEPAHTRACSKPAMQVGPMAPCLFCRHGGPDFAEGGCSRPEAPRRQGVACLDFEPPETARGKVRPSAAMGEDES